MNDPKGNKSGRRFATTKNAPRDHLPRGVAIGICRRDYSQTIVMTENLGTVITEPSPRSWTDSDGPGDG